MIIQHMRVFNNIYLTSFVMKPSRRTLVMAGSNYFLSFPFIGVHLLCTKFEKLYYYHSSYVGFSIENPKNQDAVWNHPHMPYMYEYSICMGNVDDKITIEEMVNETVFRFFRNSFSYQREHPVLGSYKNWEIQSKKDKNYALNAHWNKIQSKNLYHFDKASEIIKKKQAL